jgi:hypothetical protein
MCYIICGSLWAYEVFPAADYSTLAPEIQAWSLAVDAYGRVITGSTNASPWLVMLEADFASATDFPDSVIDNTFDWALSVAISPVTGDIAVALLFADAVMLIPGIEPIHSPSATPSISFSPSATATISVSFSPSRTASSSLTPTVTATQVRNRPSKFE